MADWGFLISERNNLESQIASLKARLAETEANEARFKECVRSMSENNMKTIQDRMDGYLFAADEIVKLKARLAEVEASEARLAEIVRRSLDLRIFVFDNPRVVANGYYIDAKVALEKRPHP